MDSRLTVLKLFLEALGQSSSINSQTDRKRIQKAVYLGQLSGVDLGYRYSWYLMGPYSTSLTRDYYALSSSLSRGDNEHEERSLNRDVLNKLANIRSILDVPADTQLTPSRWLELLASWHYLRQVSKCNREEATEIIKDKKPRLYDHIDSADARLRDAGLI